MAAYRLGQRHRPLATLSDYRKVGPHSDSTSSGVGGGGVDFSAGLEVYPRETAGSHTTECVDRLPNTNTGLFPLKCPPLPILSLVFSTSL